MPHPAVIFGGPSPEHDVSVLTGLQAARALVQAGHQVEAVYWSKTGGFFSVDPGVEAGDFTAGLPRGARELRLVAGAEGGLVPGKGGRLGRDKPLEISAAVICCHGGPGEDGTLQGALDLAGIAYTGPTVAGAAFGMDKLAFAGTVAAAGLPALPRFLLVGAPARPAPPWPGPYIVKPRFGGSSIGIEVVADWATASDLAARSVHLRRGAVVEPYRANSYDLNVAVRTWPDVQLSAIERPLRSGGSAEILGYRDKYLGGEGMVSAPRELPARIPVAMEEAIRGAALVVAGIAGARGLARIDFLAEGDDWWVNEINTIPGSLAKYLWVDPGPNSRSRLAVAGPGPRPASSGVPFLTLLTDMLAEAAARPSARYDATGADGSALLSAGTIASKLG